MEKIIFEKDEKSIEVPFLILKRTASLADPYTGKLPTTRPLEHWQFIESIAELLDKNNISFMPSPIYIGKSESKKIVQLDPDNIGLPESFLFNRVVTKFNMTSPDYSKQEYNTSIAIGYNEKGIQVALGTNVRICSNMCIFGNRLIFTYGNNRMPYDKFTMAITQYINDLPYIAEDNFTILENMMSLPINKNDIIKSIGDIHISAVNGTYFGGDSPFNIGQVSNFTQTILKLFPKFIDNDNFESISNLYDFYNIGTHILHPQRAELHDVWKRVTDWSNYITNRFISN